MHDETTTPLWAPRARAPATDLQPVTFEDPVARARLDDAAANGHVTVIALDAPAASSDVLMRDIQHPAVEGPDRAHSRSDIQEVALPAANLNRLTEHEAQCTV